VREYVLDTHAVVFYLRGRRMGREAARVFRDVDGGRAGAVVPSIVPIEMTLLRDAGRTAIGMVEFEATVGRNPAFRVLPLDFAQAREFALLPALRDPFDRMIVAAARAVQLPLITADGEIADSGLVEVVWD
jgi:PIN domain nuclease of toxin-antitoxin system